MLIPATQIFDAAYGRYAIGAYSINTLEQIHAIFRGNLRADAPFIIAVSPRARAYASPRLLEALLDAAVAEYPEAVFAIHLDHGDEQTCRAAIESGIFTSVMIDASHLSFADNVAVTRRVVEQAHARGLSVEAELGTLAGKEDDMERVQGNAMFTDPAQAAAFVERTGCDSLAVAIGTSHGLYKLKEVRDLEFDRLAVINEALPGFPLVLHGASSVPREEVRRINAAGGALDPSARGIDEDDIARMVPLGITKINIDTDSRLVWARVYREFFRDHPSEVDLRKPGETFMEAYADLIVRRSEKLGSKGKATGLRRAVQA